MIHIFFLHEIVFTMQLQRFNIKSRRVHFLRNIVTSSDEGTKWARRYIFKDISEFAQLSKLFRIFLARGKRKSLLLRTTEFVAESTRDSLQTRESRQNLNLDPLLPDIVVLKYTWIEKSLQKSCKLYKFLFLVFKRICFGGNVRAEGIVLRLCTINALYNFGLSYKRPRSYLDRGFGAWHSSGLIFVFHWEINARAIAIFIKLLYTYIVSSTGNCTLSQKIKHALIARATSDFSLDEIIKFHQNPFFVGYFNLSGIFFLFFFSFGNSKCYLMFIRMCFNGDIGAESSGQMRLTILFPTFITTKSAWSNT